MVVGHPAVRRLAFHTAQRALAAVPEVVVTNRYMRTLALDVHGAVALCLVGVATGAPIEEVHVVHPYMVVVRIQRHTVVHANHAGEVAYLHRAGIANQEAEAVHRGVVAHALDGQVHRRGAVLALHLQALCRGADLV